MRSKLSSFLKGMRSAVSLVPRDERESRITIESRQDEQGRYCGISFVLKASPGSQNTPSGRAFKILSTSTQDAWKNDWKNISSDMRQAYVRLGDTIEKRTDRTPR